jgi:drug/metabolite transporter (DMT)-like permease
VPILLSIAASIAWGTSDFLGGTLTRRLPLAVVAVISQTVGLAAVVVFLSARSSALAPEPFALGLGAGLAGGCALAALYGALASGMMSIVSPIASCAALIPFGLGLLTDKGLSIIASAGAIVALGGAAIAGHDEIGAGGMRRNGIALAGIAAVGGGLSLYLLARSGGGGNTTAGLLGSRTGAVLSLGVLAMASQPRWHVSRGSLGLLVALGLADTAATALFLSASRIGPLAMVAVLGSLYPVTTLFLARVLNGERLGRVQQLGVSLVVLGVTIVSAT